MGGGVSGSGVVIRKQPLAMEASRGNAKSSPSAARNARNAVGWRSTPGSMKIANTVLRTRTAIISVSNPVMRALFPHCKKTISSPLSFGTTASNPSFRAADTPMIPHLAAHSLVLARIQRRDSDFGIPD